MSCFLRFILELFSPQHQECFLSFCRYVGQSKANLFNFFADPDYNFQLLIFHPETSRLIDFKSLFIPKNRYVTDENRNKKALKVNKQCQEESKFINKNLKCEFNIKKLKSSLIHKHAVQIPFIFRRILPSALND